MKINLLLIGKTTDKRLQTLIDEYQNRLRHYATFEIQTIAELRNAKNMPQDEQKQREGEMILKSVNASDQLILLDEHGKEYRSISFAQQLNKWLNIGKNIIFVVGGPYGFSQDVYRRADAMLSLSQMTFSHQMIRLLFVEQLYRAFTILHNEPYHHE